MVYDDTTGLPIAGADVQALVNGVERTSRTDARETLAIPSGAGAATLRILRTGFTVVNRRVVVPDRGVVEMVDARLTPLADGVAVEATLGREVGEPSARASFAGGALTANAVIHVTPTSAQGLRGLLPAGSSPVGALDVAPAGLAVAGDLPVSRANSHAVGAGVLLAVAAWDEAAGAWRFIETTVVTAGAPLTARVPTTGQVVWLLPDTQPAPPPAQVAGQLLAGWRAAQRPRGRGRVGVARSPAGGVCPRLPCAGVGRHRDGVTAVERPDPPGAARRA